MLKRFSLIAPALTFVVIGGFLFAKKIPQNELPNKLEKFLRQLEDLQAQVRLLQDNLKELGRAAGIPQGTPIVVTSPGAPEPPPPPDPKVANLDKALAAYRRGIDFENAEMYHLAIDAFSEAVRFDPVNDSAFLHRGHSFSKIGDEAQAASDLTKSLSIQPNNTRAYVARAFSYATLGQNSLALADMDEALQRDPNNTDGLLLRGRLNQTRGDDQKAITDYTYLLTFSPDDETAHLGRAISLRRQGLDPLALADCDNAVRINPTSPAGYLCRAESYTKGGGSNRAIEQLNLAVIAPQLIEHPFTTLLETLRLMSARAPTASVQPVPTTASSTPAGTLAANGNPGAPLPAPKRPPEPPQVQAQSSARGKEDASFYVRLGRLRLGESNFEDAIKAYNQALRFDPSLMFAFNGRGYAHLRLQHLDLAINDFSEAIRLNSSLVNAYQNRSVARRLKGNRQGAMEDERKMKEILATATIPVVQPPPKGASNETRKDRKKK